MYAIAYLCVYLLLLVLFKSKHHNLPLPIVECPNKTFLSNVIVQKQLGLVTMTLPFCPEKIPRIGDNLPGHVCGISFNQKSVGNVSPFKRY